MQEISIFGHKKPDTDSVTASITLSYLKKQLGYNTVPRVLGEINKETKFVLKSFKVKTPSYLNDVKSKIKHTSFQQDSLVVHDTSILECFEYMKEKNVRTLPVVDENRYLQGIVSIRDIASSLIDDHNNVLTSNYEDVLYCLKGSEVLKFDDEINGNIIAASYDVNKIIADDIMKKNTILIVGNREEIINEAIKNKVKLIIITGGNCLNDEQLKKAELNKINVIKTTFDTYVTSNKIFLANNIMKFINNENVITVDYNMYIDEFIMLTESQKYKNYPVIDKNGRCLGIISRMHVLDVIKKDVILVDHNELSQSVDGIKEANIVEVVDHHNIGNVQTAAPINFRTMPVGCTNTIIYNMYKEYNVEIPYDMAGLMFSAIISDTLDLKSPTTTEFDKQAYNELASLLKINKEDYVYEMFKAGTSLEGMSVEEIVNSDYKEFEIKDEKIALGQVMTMDIDAIFKDKEKYVDYLNELADKNNYRLVGLFITDTIKEGSYVLYNSNSQSIIKQAFKLSEAEQGVFVDKLISRKKQMLPSIIYVMDR